MKRNLKTTLAATIAFASFCGMSAHAFASPASVRITGEPVAVRQGAGLSCQFIRQVHRGDSFPYLASKKDSHGQIWYHIQYSSDKTGWVIGQYSKAEGGSVQNKKTETTKKNADAKKSSGTVKIIGEPVAVRQNAGLKYKFIKQVHRGDRFPYLASKKDSGGQIWYRIQYSSGKTGWVTGKYSRLTSAKRADGPNNSYKINFVTYSADNGRINYQYPQISGLYEVKIQSFYNDLFKSDMEKAMENIGGGTLTMKPTVTFKSKDTLSILFEGGVFYEGAAHPFAYAYAINIDLATGETFIPSEKYGIDKAVKNIRSGKWTIVKGAMDVKKNDISDYLKNYEKKALQSMIDESDAFTVKRKNGQLIAKDGISARSYLDGKGNTVLIVDVNHALGDYARIKLG